MKTWISDMIYPASHGINTNDYKTETLLQEVLASRI